VLGLLNNAPYVIMLAAAKSISEGGTAVVYVANVVPGLAVKLTAPYWFDRVGASSRLAVAAAAMAVAFAVTAHYVGGDRSGGPPPPEAEGAHPEQARPVQRLVGELAGVALISFQCGLGEASLLALAGTWDGGGGGGDERSKEKITQLAEDTEPQINKKGTCLTGFSSGTGLAGPVGYLWKVAFTEWCGLTVSETLGMAILLAFAYAAGCYLLLKRRICEQDVNHAVDVSDMGNAPSWSEEGQELVQVRTKEGEQESFQNEEEGLRIERDRAAGPVQFSELSMKQRFHFVLGLWPYTIPLFLVYAAEYACQAGAWTAIGFPVDSVEARSQFYEQSNWLYQAGVFLSRSSGTLFTVNQFSLWLMPALQVINLLCFSLAASHKPGFSFLYQRPIFLFGSLYTGLLGGAVYVHGYKRILQDISPADYTEFALASTSVAEGLGVLVADVMGLFLQSCLYASNGLTGALVECPFG
jgi:battenin